MHYSYPKGYEFETLKNHMNYMHGAFKKDITVAYAFINEIPNGIRIWDPSIDMLEMLHKVRSFKIVYQRANYDRIVIDVTPLFTYDPKEVYK